MFRLWQRLQFFAGFLILGALFVVLWYGMLLYSERYVKEAPESYREVETVVVPSELGPVGASEEPADGATRNALSPDGGTPAEKSEGGNADLTFTGEDIPEDEAPEGREAEEGFPVPDDKNANPVAEEKEEEGKNGVSSPDKKEVDGNAPGGRGEGAVVFGKRDAEGTGQSAKEDESATESEPEPDPGDLVAMMQRLKVEKGDPVFLRVIKADRLMELWMRPREKDSYVVVKKYPIQAMSGKLGPKKKKGDMQAPEGFYRTFSGALNPNSSYYLSFNVGYPNAWDRMNRRTGSLIMVHGSNVSAGCFAMGDEGVAEIYGLVEAFVKSGPGAEGVPIQIYPFVPTVRRLMAVRKSEHYPFWRFLKDAWDWTELHKAPAPVRIGTNAMVLEGNMLSLEGVTERQVYRQAKPPERWRP